MKKIVSLLLPPLILFAVFAPGMFIKVKIACLNSGDNCPPEIESSLSGFNNQNLSKAKRSVKKILEENFLVLEYSTQFQLPNILQVQILTKKPVFAVSVKDSEIYYLVDQSGYVLSEASQTDLPYIVSLESGYSPGEKIGDATLLALSLIDGIYKMYQVRSGIVEGDTLTVDLPQGVKAILPLKDSDRDLLLGSLRLIYSNIRGGEVENNYTQIDMRYKNPVLR